MPTDSINISQWCMYTAYECTHTCTHVHIHIHICHMYIYVRVHACMHIHTDLVSSLLYDNNYNEIII